LRRGCVVTCETRASSTVLRWTGPVRRFPPCALDSLIVSRLVALALCRETHAHFWDIAGTPLMGVTGSSPCRACHPRTLRSPLPNGCETECVDLE
jgi:hypothetical protein